ncbi:MAG: hypothetical protein Hens2KO_27730 [Henriciella sp.]
MSVSERPQRLYRYVIDHDKGFAPNPFFNLCSLACCKPRIRKSATVGDVIVGFGPKKYDLGGKVIYWMEIDEVVDFETYWHDARFRRKKPKVGGSLCLNFGDNIYHRNPVTGEWIQDNSFHSDPNSLHGQGNLKRDTERTDRVLLAREYAYWGGNGPTPPDPFDPLIKSGIGETYRVDDDALQTAFIEWLKSFSDRGFINEPADWFHDKQLRQQIEARASTC